ncbi:hypothetical protein FRC12_004426 [Ceratobasidium sp. 428]|nr:hypothetical protein FRC12_004426 [Ceratobasidium sp. 428]
MAEFPSVLYASFLNKAPAAGDGRELPLPKRTKTFRQLKMERAERLAEAAAIAAATAAAISLAAPDPAPDQTEVGTAAVPPASNSKVGLVSNTPLSASWKSRDKML